MQILKINLGSFRGSVPLSTGCSVWCFPALSLPLSMILQPLIQDNSFIINHHILSQDPFWFCCLVSSVLWLSNSHKPWSLSGWTIIPPLYSLETEYLSQILSVLEYTLTCMSGCQSVCECTVWSLLIYCRSLPHLSVLSFSSHRDVFSPLDFCTFWLSVFVKAAGEKQLAVPHS